MILLSVRLDPELEELILSSKLYCSGEWVEPLIFDATIRTAVKISATRMINNTLKSGIDFNLYFIFEYHFKGAPQYGHTDILFGIFKLHFLQVAECERQ